MQGIVKNKITLVSPKFDSKANGANWIVPNAEGVNYPIIHELGSDTFASLSLITGNITITEIEGGYKIISDGTGSNAFSFMNTTEAIALGDKHLLKLTITIHTGTPIIDGFYRMSSNDTPKTLNANGDHNFETLVTDEGTPAIYFSAVTAWEMDILYPTFKKITLPTASYFTYLDQSTMALKQLSAGIDLPVSTIYNISDTHQGCFNHTTLLSNEDKEALDKKPLLIYKVWFNGYILPSGFTKEDMGNFFGGNEGLVSDKYIQDLSVALGNDTLNDGVAPTYSPGDEVVTFTPQADNSFELAVITIGTNYVRPRIISQATELYVKGDIYIFEIDITVNGGIVNNTNLYMGNENIGGLGEVTTGKYAIIHKIESAQTLQRSVMDFDGQNLFNLSVHSWTTRKATAVEILGAYTSANRLLNQQQGVNNLQLRRNTSGRSILVMPDNKFAVDSSGQNVNTGLKPNLLEYSIMQITNGKMQNFGNELMGIFIPYGANTLVSNGNGKYTLTVVDTNTGCYYTPLSQIIAKSFLCKVAIESSTATQGNIYIWDGNSGHNIDIESKNNVYISQGNGGDIRFNNLNIGAIITFSISIKQLLNKSQRTEARFITHDETEDKEYKNLTLLLDAPVLPNPNTSIVLSNQSALGYPDEVETLIDDVIVAKKAWTLEEANNIFDAWAIPDYGVTKDGEQLTQDGEPIFYLEGE